MTSKKYGVVKLNTLPAYFKIWTTKTGLMNQLLEEIKKKNPKAEIKKDNSLSEGEGEGGTFEKLNKENKDHLAKFLITWLSSDGWELINVKDYYHYYFKKTIE